MTRCGRTVPRRGATLLELLVALAVLGTIAGTVGVALRSSNGHATVGSADLVVQARRTAIQMGQPVRLRYATGGEIVSIMALPDGSVLGGAGLDISRASGRVANASR